MHTYTKKEIAASDEGQKKVGAVNQQSLSNELEMTAEGWAGLSVDEIKNRLPNGLVSDDEILAILNSANIQTKIDELNERIAREGIESPTVTPTDPDNPGGNVTNPGGGDDPYKDACDLANVDSYLCQEDPRDDPNELLTNVTNLLFIGLGIIAIGLIIYGAIMMITSSGADRAKKGRKIVVGAVIGLVIALLALVIINFVLGAIGG